MRLNENQIYCNLRLFLGCRQTSTVTTQLEMASPRVMARVLKRFPAWQADRMLNLVDDDCRVRIERAMGKTGRKAANTHNCW